MSASPSASSGKYFVPSPSHWPLVGSAALLTLAFGAVGTMNSLSWGLPLLGAGFVILLIMLFACEIIYNLLPDFKKFRWVWITPGSVVAILLWIILTTGFRTYLGFFNSYNKAYGSLGAVIIMMLWLYLTASALMIGGAINAVLHDMREKAENEENEPDSPST